MERMSSPDRAQALDLAAFIDASPSPFHAVATVAERLFDAGFTELDERESWDDPLGGHFVRRDGTLVAWLADPDRPLQQGFAVVGAHTDSPNLRIKPRPDSGSAGFRQLAVEVYGGALLNSWLDRDLGVSGRLVVETDGALREVAVLVNRPVCRVPQLAIHLDREIHERGLQLNKQTHMSPIWSEGAMAEGAFLEWLTAEAGVPAASVRGWDLMVHDLQPSSLIGAHDEWLAAPRIDNLASCYAAIEALLASGTGTTTPVVCLFDHEEVGSVSAGGAAGSVLPTVLGRLTPGGADLPVALARSACISADGAHATHPNYAERHEPSHHIALNKGPVIKRNANERYATNAVSQAIAEQACRRANVPFQHFVNRTDLACGSTIGPVTSAQLGIPTVDLGMPQLSMHSARELCGAEDPGFFVAALKAFFEA